MAIEIVFLAPPEGVTTLQAVASFVFTTLCLTETEERESAHYPPDGHYFAGYAANVVVEVSDSDDDRMSKYPFVLALKRPTYRKGTATIGNEPATVAALLARAGLRTFVPAGKWHRKDWGGEGIEYAP